MASSWTFYYLAGNDPLYVYLCPPGTPQGPILFTLAGLGAEQRRELAGLVRGDVVPAHLLAALHALQARGASAGRAAGHQASR
jgi:hypothetical protein